MKARTYFFILVLIAVLPACNKKMTKAMYEGADISRDARIIRDKNTKETSLDIQTNGDWKIYAGDAVENIDFSKPLLEGNGSGIFQLPVNNSSRSYFQLITSQGKAILAEKHLPMTGGYNFRDLGGIKTLDGKHIKWGKLFRTDDLANLTDNDLQYLASIPIRTDVDFRSETEVEYSKDKVPSGASYHGLSIQPGNVLYGESDFEIDTINFNEVMMDMNRLFVTDSACIERYKEFFRLVQDNRNIPLLYHCSAGKDRTGMATALILYALGVDEKTILEDYLLSNKYLGDKYASYIKQYPAIEPLMTVKPEFLQAGIDQIKKDHGTVENYLVNVLGVDIPEMKKTFLY